MSFRSGTYSDRRAKSCGEFWHEVFITTGSVHFLLRPRSKISDRKFRSGKISQVM